MKTWLKQLRMFSRVLRVKTVITIDRIDQEAIAKRLKVDKRARNEAQENRPETTAAGPDVHEQAIVTYCRGLLRAINAWYRHAFRLEQAQQDQAALHCAPERLEACYEAAQQALATHATTFRDPLLAARQRERRAFRQLKSFRDEHDLTREAHYPASLSLHYALLAVAVLGEGLLNCYFFARGSDYGLLGGFFEALMVAGVNVALAFLVGKVVRGLHSPSLTRVLAIAVGVLYVGVLIWFQLAVGHYRMALAGGTPELAVSQAMTHLTHEPLTISDFHTWLLMAVGVLCAIGAVIAGYTSDDPVMRYGAVTRHGKAAEAAYQGLKEQYVFGIHAIVELQLNAVESRMADAKAALTTYRASVAEAKHVGRNYMMACAALADACIALQQRYCAINSTVRTTPSPAYFAEPSSLPFTSDEFLHDELAAVAAAERSTTELLHQLSTLQVTADAVKGRLRALYAAHLHAAPAYFAAIEATVDGPTAQPAAGIAPEEKHVIPHSQEVSNGVSHAPSL
jgi:hypothetical protein